MNQALVNLPFSTSSPGWLTVQDIIGCTSQFIYDVPDSAVACSYTGNVQPVSASGVCDGSVAIAILGSAPIAYVWTTGSTDSSLINLCEGTYFFQATDSNGCVVADSIVIGVNSTVNIPEEIIKSSMLIYPNPGRNELHIILPENISNENYLLSIYNSQGKLLFESNSIDKIPFAKWPSGLYEFTLRYGIGVLKTRWVKG